MSLRQIHGAPRAPASARIISMSGSLKSSYPFKPFVSFPFHPSFSPAEDVGSPKAVMALNEKTDAGEVTPFGVGSPRAVPMRVVVCGLGRTGTASMKTALEILGFPTYHAFNFWADSEENVKRWNRAIDIKYHGKGAFDPFYWDHILGNYLGVVDAPAAFFATDIAEAYPDAKVVILNRDFDPWFRSCQAAFTHRDTWMRQIFSLIFFWDSRIRALGSHMDRKQAEIWGFEWHEPGAREKARVYYDKYYADCRARIPEHRRIEFKVQDGWEPLCEHLGVEVPTVRVGDGRERTALPFPRTNEAAQFKQRLGKARSMMMRRALWGWANRIVMGAAAGYCLYRVAVPMRTWVLNAL